jgi:hypothetical protein
LDTLVAEILGSLDLIVFFGASAEVGTYCVLTK